MTYDFTSFSTVFQSNQDDARVKMKDGVQWNPVYDWEDFASSGDRVRDRTISRTALNLLSYRGSINWQQREQKCRPWPGPEVIKLFSC